MSKRSSISFETKLHVVQRCLEHKSNPNPRSTSRLVSSDSRTEQRKRLRNYKVVYVSRGCSICLLQVVKMDAIRQRT